MNLVNELQVSAEQDDVLTVLRKTKRLASKLGQTDILDWLRHEMEGYPRGDLVPAYRQVGTTLAMNTNGHVPAGYGYLMNGVHELPGVGFHPMMPVVAPVSTILSWIVSLSKGKAIFHPIERHEEADDFFRKHVDPMFQGQVDFMLHLNDSQVKAIPDQIKDKVLDWACALEQAGVNGEGQSFNQQEKRIASSITINISGSQIEQLNNMGTNVKR
jgi:hypothetical protein